MSILSLLAMNIINAHRGDMKRECYNKLNTRLELQSDSNDWCEEWGGVTKDFYVGAYCSNGEPLEGEVIEIIFHKNTSNKYKLHQLNVAVTDANGRATVKVRINGPAGNEFSVLAQSVETSQIKSVIYDPMTSEPFVISMREIAISEPRIPLALDSIIDDTDYKSDIYAVTLAGNIRKDDQVYLMWGNNKLLQTAEEDTNQIIFGVSEKKKDRNEVLFNNGTHDVRTYIVDITGSSRYSAPFHVYVERKSGGGALPYLPAIEIQRENHEVITKDDINQGILVEIQNQALSYNGPGGREIIIDDPLGKSSSGNIELTSHNENGEVIEVLGINLEYPLNIINEKYSYRDDALLRPLEQFLKRIGKGYFYASYNIEIDGKTFSPHTIQAYNVDLLKK